MGNTDAVFHDLSKGLTQKEREELIGKIKASLSLDDENSGLHQEEMGKDEKVELIRKEMEKLSLFRRFFLWLRARITGKSENDILMSKKLHSLKRKIKQKDSRLTGFETRNLTPHFADLVYELYLEVLPFQKLFKKLWLEEESYKVFFLELIEKKLSRKIEKIDDLVPPEDIIAAFGIAGKRENVQSVIIKNLDKYVDGIKKDVFTQLEIELLPFYHLKNLVLFPYVQFFQQFGYTLLETPYTDTPQFKNASAALCLDDIEKLYFAVYTALKLDKRIRIGEDILDLSNALIEESSNDDLASDFISLITKVRWFSSRVPLADLIRYFKRNPYIKMVLYVPGIDLREFYRNTLKIKLLKILDKKFPEIHKQYIILETERLFSGKRFVQFQNYREYSSIDYEKLGVSPFRNIRPLALVYNFTQCFYKGYIQLIVRFLEKSILSENRLLRDNMLQYASTIEDIAERIRIFDESLSPDSEDGKVFHKIRFSMVKDISQQKFFRKIVIQKDREAKNLAETGLDALQGLKRVLSEVNKSTNGVIIDQLKQHYLVDNKPVVLQELLDDAIEKLAKTEHLYHHLLIGL